MKNKDILNCYNYLGNSVKMSSLSDKKTRQDFIRFYLSLRKAANGIISDLNALLEKPFDDDKASKEVRGQVLEEEYAGDLPKVKDDILLEVVAESGNDVPLEVVFASFEPFFE